MMLQLAIATSTLWRLKNVFASVHSGNFQEKIVASAGPVEASADEEEDGHPLSLENSPTTLSVPNPYGYFSFIIKTYGITLGVSSRRTPTCAAS